MTPCMEKRGKMLLENKMKNVKMIIKYWHSWWYDVWGLDNLIIINDKLIAIK